MGHFHTKKSLIEKQQGFTIVELLIVIVIIAILAAIAITAFTAVRQRAADTAVKSDLLTSYKLLANDLTTSLSYPSTTAAANGGKGLPSSNGTTYNYTVNNSGTPNFSLIGSSPSTSNKYIVTNLNSVPTLVTGSPPVVTYPSGNTVSNNDGCGGSYFYFGLNSLATGSPTPTLQWQRLSAKNTTTGTWIDISGATTTYYSFDTRVVPLGEPDYLVFRPIWTSGSYTTIGPTIQIALTNGC